MSRCSDCAAVALSMREEREGCWTMMLTLPPVALWWSTPCHAAWRRRSCML